MATTGPAGTAGAAGWEAKTRVNARASRRTWAPPSWTEQFEQWEEPITIMRVGFLRATSDILRAALAATESHLQRIESESPEIPFEKIFPDDEDDDEPMPATRGAKAVTAP